MKHTNIPALCIIALALGIMHILQRDALVDRDFIAANVQGYADFAATILPDYGPEHVASLTGILPSVIFRLFSNTIGRRGGILGAGRHRDGALGHAAARLRDAQGRRALLRQPRAPPVARRPRM